MADDSSAPGLTGRILALAGEKPASLFNLAAALCLVAILVLTTVDVFGRYALNAPVRGKTELTRVLMSMMIALAMPAAILRGHSIVVDLLDARFSPRMAALRDLLANLLCGGGLLVLAYWIRFLGLRQQRWGNVTEFLGIPLYPITFFIAAMFVVAGAMFGLRALADLARLRRRLRASARSGGAQ